MAELEDFRCFVGGLSWNTTDRDLEDAFQRFGRIVEAKVIVDRDTGRPKGFGFVSFADERDMEDAIDKMNGRDLDDRAITVSKAQSKSRGGGGGGSRGYNAGGSDYGKSSGGRGGVGGGNECFKCGQMGHWARECPSEAAGGGRYSDNSYASSRGDRYNGSRGGNYSNSNSRYARDDSYDKRGGSRGGSYRDGGGRGSRSGPYDRPVGGGNRSSRDDY
ncbi:hypothetical protein O6H91_01G034200 [Diphasiastrum complanatum]|uniref:Uncharacterized protein n=2 Tax=Diphasiastrum complanatum TaxID=34168 RepID=A0ACC2EPU7_DIPCM|nr:hypothetical protein O6H91_01G034200 [Diphasiastrum complanatum]KAJ7568484.1 hypothetical protein O6H91_01G034200 [Diphasiastrum complanatum]